jgi:hypothetical protein
MMATSKPFRKPMDAKRSALISRTLKDMALADNGRRLHELCDKLFRMALAGSERALKIVIERVDGRVGNNADDGADATASLTQAQVTARFAELLATPDVRELVSKILLGQAPVDEKPIQ